jgi:hypothetical protein
MTTRSDLSYILIKELNPTMGEVPELYHKSNGDFIMKRHYQACRWPKAKLPECIFRVEHSRLAARIQDCESHGIFPYGFTQFSELKCSDD